MTALSSRAGLVYHFWTVVTFLSTGVMAITAIVGASFYLIQRLQRKKITWELIKRPDSETALTKRE